MCNTVLQYNVFTTLSITMLSIPCSSPCSSPYSLPYLLPYWYQPCSLPYCQYRVSKTHFWHILITMRIWPCSWPCSWPWLLLHIHHYVYLPYSRYHIPIPYFNYHITIPSSRYHISIPCYHDHVHGHVHYPCPLRVQLGIAIFISCARKLTGLLRLCLWLAPLVAQIAFSITNSQRLKPVSWKKVG